MSSDKAQFPHPLSHDNYTYLMNSGSTGYSKCPWNNMGYCITSEGKRERRNKPFLAFRNLDSNFKFNLILMERVPVGAAKV